MTNGDELSPLAAEPFSNAVSHFKQLISSSNGLTFLMGAGCSKCAGLPLTMELTQMIADEDSINDQSKAILEAVKANFADATDSHIEDYLSEIGDLLAITARRAERGANDNKVSVGAEEYTAEDLHFTSDQIKRAVARAIEGTVDISTHRDFVAAVHKPIRVGRPVSSQPVEYLVLNYDTIVEDALALESITYADGLHGGTTGWWDPLTFDERGLSARVIKLHGSIDWRQLPHEEFPRRIAQSIEIGGRDDLPVLIWPASTKYREAQLDPFAQLLERARIAIRPAAGLQRFLVVCGYSFGDSHINQELDKALRESQGKLTLAAFTNENRPTGLLKKWFEDEEVREQVLLFANRGFYHHDKMEVSPEDLLWWQFENLTRMLKGEV